MSKWKRVPRLVGLFESHWAAAGIIIGLVASGWSIAVGWLASLSAFLDPWAPLSYGVAALIAFLSATLGITGSMALYGVYRSKLAASRSLISPDQNEKNEDEPTTSTSKEKIDFIRRVFVGQHNANKQRLRSERIIHLSFICFNGNDKSIPDPT